MCFLIFLRETFGRPTNRVIFALRNNSVRPIKAKWRMEYIGKCSALSLLKETCKTSNLYLYLALDYT